jgi:hypothetical protein
MAICFFAEYSEIYNEATETESFVRQEDKNNEELANQNSVIKH